MLAAGASRRAGCAKALATLEGEPLVHRAARALWEGGVDDVIVVVGPPHGERVARAARGAWVVQNREPERGMLSSLKVGLEVGAAVGWDAAVVSLVDQPHVDGDHVRALLRTARASLADLVRLEVGGRRGHPYLVTRRVFRDLLAADDEGGARPVLRGVQPSATVRVDDPRVLEDVDTPLELTLAGVVAC